MFSHIFINLQASTLFVVPYNPPVSATNVITNIKYLATFIYLIDKKMFPSKKIILQISRFLNKKNLLGCRKISIHSQNTKSKLIFQLKQFFKIKHNQFWFRLKPFDHFSPLIPEITFCFRTLRFSLNQEWVSDLSEYNPILFSSSEILV